MRSLVLAGLGAILAGLLGTAPAAAVTTNVAGHFLAHDWTVHQGDPTSPPPPLFLDFAISFDATQDYLNDTGALTINATNIAAPIRFSYSSQTGVIALATAGLPNGCTISLSSFCALLTDFDDGVPYFVVKADAEGGAWRANFVGDNRQVEPLNPGVPEPASWAMLIAGFGLTGAATRRRRMARA